MEITSMQSFLKYYERTRQQTNNVIRAIPPEQIEWTYKPGKFSFGDLLRHIAGIERYVFAEIARGNTSSYRGCGKEIADGYDAVMQYFHTMHQQSVEILQAVPDASLQQIIKSVDGREIQLGSFLRALVVHEVHHRGALCIYLNLLGVASPPVIGLTEEQVKQLSANAATF